MSSEKEDYFVVLGGREWRSNKRKEAACDGLLSTLASQAVTRSSSAPGATDASEGNKVVTRVFGAALSKDQVTGTVSALPVCRGTSCLQGTLPIYRAVQGSAGVCLLQ